MKSRNLFTLLGCLGTTICFSQSIDTIYYNRDMKGVPDKAFADYYKVVLIPSDSNYSRIFRDFSMNGELLGEGEFVSIDRYDDSKSVFSGEYKNYFRNGLIQQHGFYSNGKKNGVWTLFSNDGKTYSQLEYKDDYPTTDYYIITDDNGFSGKFSIKDDQPIWENPNLDELKVRYREGLTWQYYIKNGLMVSMNLSTVKDYGKYYRIDLVIANNTLGQVDFEPNDTKAILTDFKKQRWYLGVFPAEVYMHNVTRKQNFEMAMYGLAQGLAAVGAGYSSSNTTSNSYYSGSSYGSAYGSAIGTDGYTSANVHGSGYYNGSISTTTTTNSYNGAAAYQASVIAGYQVAAFDEAKLEEREAKNKGYLKLTTIEPGETISGYILVERKKGIDLTIIIDIYGAQYVFPWEL